MGMPTFRFVDAGEAALFGEEEFWRDVAASDRLASPLRADLYLRELCRTKAREDAMIGFASQRGESLERRERALLQEVRSRGYRLRREDDGEPHAVEVTGLETSRRCA